jgi:hypothetical protein
MALDLKLMKACEVLAVTRREGAITPATVNLFLLDKCDDGKHSHSQPERYW